MTKKITTRNGVMVVEINGKLRSAGKPKPQPPESDKKK